MVSGARSSEIAAQNPFLLPVRLTDVLFCDSLGTCAFECLDLL